jgi:hypothetical protein
MVIKVKKVFGACKMQILSRGEAAFGTETRNTGT